MARKQTMATTITCVRLPNELIRWADKVARQNARKSGEFCSRSAVIIEALRNAKAGGKGEAA